MRIYLDDDSVDSVLVSLLRKSGHDVALPSEFAQSGSVDPVHLRMAIRAGRALMTCNHDDFEVLHDLILESAGHHPGILVVRRDNDPRRDMSLRGTVNAIRRLMEAGVPVADQFIVLNHWR
jgi:hypothetical protein